MSEPASETEGETITIHELLERSAESALELQREDGSFPPGRNYTYDEPETPVRTTSHWTVTISEVYDITGEEKYREAAEAAVDYLLTDDVRPDGYTFHCRDAPGKDRCNGLVGQATPIRALSHAGPILERDDAIRAAEEVFELHPFDDRIGLWERVEIDGTKLSFDRTLNHQILFAAACRKISAESELVTDVLRTFLDNLASNMRFHSDGIIKHYVRPSPIKSLNAFLRERRHWQLILNEFAYHYYSYKDERKRKEVGYQPVNLRGLAQLKAYYPDHSVWKQALFNSKLNIPEVQRCNAVDYGSVIPGISFAWASLQFNQDEEQAAAFIQEDLVQRLDPREFQLTSGEVDSIDQSSAISFLVDLPNLNVRYK